MGNEGVSGMYFAEVSLVAATTGFAVKIKVLNTVVSDLIKKFYGRKYAGGGLRWD